MRIALFDFDGTLTSKDTVRLFVLYLGKKYHKLYEVFLFYLILLLARLRIMSDKKMKESFLVLFLRGRGLKDVKHDVMQFFNSHLNSLLNTITIGYLRGHCNQGDKVYLLSANFDFFLEPLINLWGITGVIATQAERTEEIFTGRVIGNSCKGKDKFTRIKALFSNEEISKMIVYGDREDETLLGMVGEVKLV